MKISQSSVTLLQRRPELTARLPLNELPQDVCVSSVAGRLFEELPQASRESVSALLQFRSLRPGGTVSEKVSEVTYQSGQCREVLAWLLNPDL